MSKKNELKMKLPTVDDLFSTEEQRQEAKLTKIYDIPITEIDDFPDHPFRVRDDEDMRDLIESIRERGVITPATVRKKDDGRYEMISGHRRKRACELLGMETLRCEVVEMTKEEATIMMVDSNNQRSVIAPCDKGKAYRMRMEALNRQGKRTDLTCHPVGQKLKPINSRDELAGSVTDSARQISRYIRLTYLVPELQQFVDAGRMKLRPAVELSYLDEDAQRDVVDHIDETEAFPSHDQAIRIREAFDSGELDYDKVGEIMREQKPNQKKTIAFNYERIAGLIPKELTEREQEDYIVRALEQYNRYLQRQQNNAR